MTEQDEQKADQSNHESHRFFGRQSRTQFEVTIATLFVAFPPALFYAILFRKALNVPFLDDYSALLDFLNQFLQLKTVSAKASYFLASQLGEFKLVFLHALSLLQLGEYGHINFTILGAIGNGFVFLLVILLWRMFLPFHRNFASRLALFVPVSCLVFQLQYWETLNWATSGLQHIAVLVFSFGVIYLLVRGERGAYCFALASLILAVASDGNGILLIPIGVSILTFGRHYKRVVGWLLVSAGCVAVYAYHYKVVLLQTYGHGSAFMSAPTEARRSVVSIVLRFRPEYVLSFIGSAASFPFKSGSLVLGILLCVFFVYTASRGYIRRNPLVSYCVLFLYLTAVGVAGLRSANGVEQSLSSRYTIYSALLLVFAWFEIVEEFLQWRRESLLDSAVFLGAVGASVLFSLCMDFVGFNALEMRNRALAQSMAEFEHPNRPESSPSPAPLALVPGPHGATNDFNPAARAIMIQSIKLGVYRPPPL